MAWRNWISLTCARIDGCEVSTLKAIPACSAREAKAIAERDVSRLREQLEEREEEVETMRQQIVNLRREREEVRGRVEKMLKQIDVLAEAS